MSDPYGLPDFRRLAGDFDQPQDLIDAAEASQLNKVLKISWSNNKAGGMKRGPEDASGDAQDGTSAPKRSKGDDWVALPAPRNEIDSDNDLRDYVLFCCSLRQWLPSATVVH
jgi:hypothetical protein